MRTGRASQGQQRGTVGRAIEPPRFWEGSKTGGKKGDLETKGGQGWAERKVSKRFVRVHMHQAVLTAAEVV